MTRPEHERIVAVVEGISRVLEKLEERVRREPELLEALAIPSRLHPLIAREENRGLQLARYDLFPGNDGWMISEFHEERIPELLAEQQDWVIKHAFGRMGEAVVIGALIPPTEWRSALEEARRRSGEYVLQKRFHVAPLKFSEGLQHPALGAYLVNGRFAG